VDDGGNGGGPKTAAPAETTPPSTRNVNLNDAAWRLPADSGANSTANIRPAQELLPSAVRPPFFLDVPPQTVGPFKQPIPRLSRAEGANNAPSWARGNRPYVGENGRDFAKRLMDGKYGPGNWTPRISNTARYKMGRSLVS
jgi:hypothetical protein